MTIAEQHIYFKTIVDKIDSFNSDLFEPEQIDTLFNLKQFELIKKITINGIEETQTKTDMLARLIVTQPINTFTANDPLLNHPNGYFVILPNDYMKTINEECICEQVDCHGNTVEVRRKVVPTNRDRINVVLDNPFTKPDNEYVVRLAYSNFNTTSTGGQYELITNGAAPLFYLLTYYRLPVQMGYFSQYPTPSLDIDCELNTEAQLWIIEEAAKEALLQIESQRYTAIKQEEEKLNY